MPTDLEERRTQLLAELEQQNLTWAKARKQLAGLGRASVSVPRSFFDQLDALGPAPTRPVGIRG